MRMNNFAISEVFNEFADLLEIKGENPFRIRAYRNAARTIEGLPEDIADILNRGDDLTEFPGIGKDLAGKIAEVAETGHLKPFDELKKELSPELAKLMKIAGLGGKRVSTIHQRLGVQSLQDLEKAAREHKIRALPGFGEKIEQGIIEGIEHAHTAGNVLRLSETEDLARSFLAYLKIHPKIQRLIAAGSFRRRKETVRDLDILTTCSDQAGVIEHFSHYPGIARIVSQGDTRSTISLTSGFQVDLRVVADQSYGAALHYFTGSQAHNIAVRKRGVKLGVKINEYGVFRGSKLIGGTTESEVFDAVGLPYIEPELREDRGEIEAALAGNLPKLIAQENIRGDLHVHTTATDGHAGIREMVAAAVSKGYSYIAITDHSQRLAMTHGLSAAELNRQIDEIDRLNESLENFTILKGMEVDILEDGSLDLPDRVLSQLDLTVCSIHSHMNLPRPQQTDRIVKAMENPNFTILGHPTGRLIGRRPPCDIDMEQVIAAARKQGCFLELNSYPDRLDMDDSHCRRSKEMGVKIAIDTDAHSIRDLDFMRFGIGQARRGWIEPTDVINTLSIEKLMKLLRKRKS